jgi:hypothetical protein
VVCFACKKANEPNTENEYVPHVYIPHKPHPNGLLAYLSCNWIQDETKGKRKPFFVDISPHILPSDQSEAFPFFL